MWGESKGNTTVFQPSLFLFLPKYNFRFDGLFFVWSMSIYSPAIGSNSRAVKCCCSAHWPSSSRLAEDSAHSAHRSSASPNRFSQCHSLPLTPCSAFPCAGTGMHENILSTLYCHLLEWSILATRLAVGVTRRLAPNNHAFPTTPASYLGPVHLLAEICFWMSCPMMKPGIVHTHVAQKPSFFLQ